MERFSSVRDLLYLAFFFTGLGLGSFAGIRGFGGLSPRRTRLITLGLCFLSVAAAAFTGALFYGGRPSLSLVLKPLLAPGCVIVVLSAVALNFPRTVAFPLVLLWGLGAVWLGYSFLRFPMEPSPSAPLVSVYRERDNSVALRIRQPYQGRIMVKDNGLPLRFRAAFVRFGDLVPLIGGHSRGGLYAVQRGKEIVAGSPGIPAYYERFPARAGSWGISYRRYEAVIAPASLDGEVFFTGAGLTGGAGKTGAASH